MAPTDDEKEPKHPQVWWMATIPFECWVPQQPLPDIIGFIAGQQECSGPPANYHHWQIIMHLTKKRRLASIKKYFPERAHFDAVKCIDEALNYCAKDDETTCPGTRFSFGSHPFRRNCKRDWDEVYQCAKNGDLDDISADVLVRYYNNLKKIKTDFMTPPRRENVKGFVYWGLTGTGKTTRAFDEAPDAYFKIASNKWWDGYRGQESVILDEFTGQVSVEHILRWINWAPCLVETKGGTIPLLATTFYFTSNVNPEDWWDNINIEQYRAFKRRVVITHFSAINPTD